MNTTNNIKILATCAVFGFIAQFASATEASSSAAIVTERSTLLNATPIGSTEKSVIGYLTSLGLTPTVKKGGVVATGDRRNLHPHATGAEHITVVLKREGDSNILGDVITYASYAFDAKGVLIDITLKLETDSP